MVYFETIPFQTCFGLILWANIRRICYDLLVMARRPDRKKAEVLSEEDLKQLRHNLAHLSIGAVQDFYERAYRDCRLIYHRLPSPKQMQMLVQAWKQLWKWR